MLRFWNAFGTDWRENCLSWDHRGIFIAPEGNEWKSRWTANPDILGRHLFYRGNGIQENRPGEYHDRIALGGIRWIEEAGVEIRDGRVVVDVGAPGEFDGHDVLDPAAVEFEGRILLYYSAIGEGPDSVGLAVSEDGGATFRKVGKVLVGRAPEALVQDGKILMLAQQLRGETYELFLYESEDGETFRPVGDQAAFGPEPGSWDSLSVVTVRHVGSEDGWHYFVYGGSTDHADEPDFFGLARSKDLREWERHPGNPIFGTGPKGEPDGGALWFPALLETPNGWLMLYEGSEGRYSWSLLSQICGAFKSAEGVEGSRGQGR